MFLMAFRDHLGLKHGGARLPSDAPAEYAVIVRKGPRLSLREAEGCRRTSKSLDVFVASFDDLVDMVRIFLQRLFGLLELQLGKGIVSGHLLEAEGHPFPRSKGKA